jgi:hypothetical protein
MIAYAFEIFATVVLVRVVLYAWVSLLIAIDGPGRQESAPWRIESKSRLTCWIAGFTAYWMFIGCAIPEPASSITLVAWASWLLWIGLDERRKNRRPRPLPEPIILHYKPRLGPTP